MTSAFVIGPGKSGTTLMISLLDNHPDLSVIPLEIKFYDHYYKSLAHTSSYDRLNQFFLSNSKLTIMDSQESRAPDITNSGYVNFSNVDFQKFKSVMDDKVKQYQETGGQQSLLPRYIEDIHQAYAQLIYPGSKQGFAIKEGCHGLPYIDSMKADFKNESKIIPNQPITEFDGGDDETG